MPSTVFLDANILRDAEPWRLDASDAHPALRSTIFMPPYGAVAATPQHPCARWRGFPFVYSLRGAD